MKTFAIALALVTFASSAFACGNGTKCCWEECRAGRGCIQHCDDGRKTDEQDGKPMVRNFTPLQLAQNRMCNTECFTNAVGRRECVTHCQ